MSRIRFISCMWVHRYRLITFKTFLYAWRYLIELSYSSKVFESIHTGYLEQGFAHIDQLLRNGRLILTSWYVTTILLQYTHLIRNGFLDLRNDIFIRLFYHRIRIRIPKQLSKKVPLCWWSMLGMTFGQKLFLLIDECAPLWLEFRFNTCIPFEILTHVLIITEQTTKYFSLQEKYFTFHALANSWNSSRYILNDLLISKYLAWTNLVEILRSHFILTNQ